MRTPRTIARDQWLARAGAALWLGLATWRLILSTSTDGNGFGEAQRQYPGLLLLQGLCALFAAGAILGVRDAAMSGERGTARAYRAIAVVAIAGFFIVFAKHDLMAFGSYED